MSPPPVLVTGATGFAGGHLVRLLLARGERVAALARPESLRRLPPGVRALPFDFRKAEGIGAILRGVRPREIYHLAGQADVAEAFRNPTATIEVNFGGGLALLEAVRGLRSPPRVVVVTSSQVYADPPGRKPLTEASPLHALDPYSASKGALDLLAEGYARAYRLPIVRVRPFNHLGPGQSPRFAAARFAREIALIEAGRKPPLLKVGNLSARRDFTDVRDIVRGYLLAARRGRAGEAYNLCSGRAPSIRGILRGLLAQGRVPIRVERDPSLLRPVDAAILLGDGRKAARDLGWKPRIPLEETLRDLLEEARSRVASGGEAP